MAAAPRAKNYPLKKGDLVYATAFAYKTDGRGRFSEYEAVPHRVGYVSPVRFFEVINEVTFEGIRLSLPFMQDHGFVIDPDTHQVHSNEGRAAHDIKDEAANHRRTQGDRVQFGRRATALMKVQRIRIPEWARIRPTPSPVPGHEPPVDTSGWVPDWWEGGDE